MAVPGSAALEAAMNATETGPGIDRAAQRVQLASRALRGAHEDLLIVERRAEAGVLEQEALRIGEMAEQVARLRGGQ
jgi:hypothetical protein